MTLHSVLELELEAKPPRRSLLCKSCMDVRKALNIAMQPFPPELRKMRRTAPFGTALRLALVGRKYYLTMLNRCTVLSPFTEIATR